MRLFILVNSFDDYLIKIFLYMKSLFHNNDLTLVSDLEPEDEFFYSYVTKNAIDLVIIINEAEQNFLNLLLKRANKFGSVSSNLDIASSSPNISCSIKKIEIDATTKVGKSILTKKKTYSYQRKRKNFFFTALIYKKLKANRI